MNVHYSAMGTRQASAESTSTDRRAVPIQTKNEETQMFEQTFVQGTGESRKPWPVAASFTGQLIVVGIILMVPLMQTARIAWPPATILYAPPRAVPPPLKVEVRTSAQTAASLVRAVFQPRFTAPTHIPTKIVTMGGDDFVPPMIGMAGDMTGTGGSAALPFSTDVAPPKVQEAAPVKPTSVRMSTGVQQAMLIHEVKPPYPPLARTARVSGVVRLAAVIARDGTIQHLQLINGPPLLVKAALEAVQQWRYKPTLLSGEAVEVITEIDVNFTLSN
jgi:periplasmic protein TonB